MDNKRGPFIRSTAPPVPKAPGVVSITSGKGGVGKTVLAANLGVALARAGKKILLLDADLGLANIDVLFGLKPKHNLNHFFAGEKELAELVVEGPQGVKILPAGSGMQAMMSLTTDQKLRFREAVETFHGQFDLVIIDTEAGISENVTYFNVAAQEIVLVTTPEPAAVTNTSALMGLLAARYHERRFQLMVNMAQSETHALEVYRSLTRATTRYRDVSINYLGYLPFDKHLPEAISRQQALVELYPRCRAGDRLADMAQHLAGVLENAQPKGTIQFFWKHLLAGCCE